MRSSPVVQNAGQEHLPCAVLAHFTLLFQQGIVAIWQISCEEENHNTREDMKEARNKHRPPPRVEGFSAFADRCIDEGHDEVGHTATKVAPSGCGGISKACMASL